MTLLHATTRGKFGVKTTEFLLPDLCSSFSKRKSQGLSQTQKRKKNNSEGLNRVALKQRMSIYYVIYLSVTGFTINSFLFFKKNNFIYGKIVIIESSDSHNYDSYIVEFTKAASATRGVHADRRPALKQMVIKHLQRTKPCSPHAPLFELTLERVSKDPLSSI